MATVVTRNNVDSVIARETRAYEQLRRNRYTDPKDLDEKKRQIDDLKRFRIKCMIDNNERTLAYGDQASEAHADYVQQRAKQEKDPEKRKRLERLAVNLRRSSGTGGHERREARG